MNLGLSGNENSTVDGSTFASSDDGRSLFNEQVDDLTSEDIAWVDSCLIKEIPDISNSDWDLVKNALLEIPTVHPEDFLSSGAASDNLQGGSINTNTDIDMLPSNNGEPTFPSGSTDDLVVPFNEAKIAADDSQNDDNIENSILLSFKGNPFLPTYNDEEEKENIQIESSLDSSEIGSEPPISDIFRVWELNIPAVEDELVEQLNKALSESGLNGFKEGLLDDLVDGISSLSLERNS